MGCFDKQPNFTLNQNKTYLFNIEINIKGLKAGPNEPWERDMYNITGPYLANFKSWTNTLMQIVSIASLNGLYL